MDEELKPCPFCGRPPEFTRYIEDNGYMFEGYECPGCLVKKDSISTWNTRVEQPPSREMVERVVELARLVGTWEKPTHKLSLDEIMAELEKGK